MLYISDKTLKTIRDKTDIKKEDRNRAVYWIPKDVVNEHAVEDEIREDVACKLGRRLAKNKWGCILDKIVDIKSKEHKDRDIFFVSVSITKKN